MTLEPLGAPDPLVEGPPSRTEDPDGFWAHYGLVRRWRDIPEPAPVDPVPGSLTQFPRLGAEDLIAYDGQAEYRDSSYFCYGTEENGGRLLAGRLFIESPRLEAHQIVRTWGGDATDSDDLSRREALLAARAVEARYEAVLGNTGLVEKFMAADLGLWRGARWQEPVATALLGEWASTLSTHGTIRRGALDRLKSDVREIHRQLTPIWRRRCGGMRLLSLDLAISDGGLTLGDLIADGPDPAEALMGGMPDNPDVLVVLNQLSTIERAVALAWARPSTASWTEAAADVLDLDPRGCAGSEAQALGERVRRKLKRLGDRRTSRSAAARAHAREAAGTGLMEADNKSAGGGGSAGGCAEQSRRGDEAGAAGE